MPSRTCSFRLTLVLHCALVCWCQAVLGQAHNTNPLEPTLFDKRPTGNEGAGPQYVIVDLPEKKLLNYYPELKDLAPAQSQQDLPKLLERVGANENTLWSTLPGISVDEDVVQEQLDKHGWVRGLPVFTGHYSYVVRAHLAGEGVRLNEGRADKNWQAINPDVPSGFSLLKGFAMLPLHFHPFHQSASNFRYLGRQIVDSREFYVVAFAQQPEKAELLGVVRVGGTEITVAYQGIAWIDPDNFQIAHMRIDLLKARPEAGTEITDVRFNEVHLPVVAKSFWLPIDAVVTRSTKDGALREKHKFSDYRIFTQYKTLPATQPVAEKAK